MITVQLENLEERLGEIKALLPQHWEELAINRDKVPLSPNYDFYVQYERSGQLIFATLREDGHMMGYFIGFITPGLHYSQTLTCKMDIFYIHPSCRGSALPGLKLFRAVEKELKRRGVQQWYVGSKIKHDASALFKRLGFEPVEVYHSKYIGG
jgi:N-acetylglutamate synthase-like GNAT family acetyltransferase